MLMQIFEIVFTVLDWTFWLSILSLVLLVGYCSVAKKNIHWKLGKFELIIDVTEQQADHQ
ncbi:hypothetical protein [Anaerocellum danielii]|uniref:Uncharacterized protein n=1 Tax=Anaerocellum danielii TaxID=1387557 RepID=A0ABZ0TXH2_9FIRM|nr:hypothetical protein [Caldicellulosiruptor danielii]WPX08125.1 hypothetical protein SOJ16_001989 [Caldicellulosiruptor danielii]